MKSLKLKRIPIEDIPNYIKDFSVDTTVLQKYAFSSTIKELQKPYAGGKSIDCELNQEVFLTRYMNQADFDNLYIDKDIFIIADGLALINTFVSVNASSFFEHDFAFLRDLYIIVFETKFYCVHKGLMNSLAVQDAIISYGDLAGVSDSAIAPKNLNLELMKSTAESNKESYVSELLDLQVELAELQNGTHPAIKEMTDELKRIKAELELKKQETYAMMDAKKSELATLKVELEKQVSVVDATIFNLESYFGEAYTLTQLRKGKSAPADMPVVISQKLRFLTEDLPVFFGTKASSLVQGDNYSDFGEALKNSDSLLEYFSNSEKSIEFFRLGRTDTVGLNYNYGFTTDNLNGTAIEMVEKIALKGGLGLVGFVVRDGENAYLGVSNSPENLYVQEDVFYDMFNTAKTETQPVTVSDDEDIDFFSDSAAEIARKRKIKEQIARRFIFSTIQGLHDNKKVFTFEKEFNIFKLANVVFSSASGHITTNKYGTIINLVNKLNLLTRVGDPIYVLTTENSRYRFRMSYKATSYYEASSGISVGLSEINLKKAGEYFVKARRAKLSNFDTTMSNFKIDVEEFINLSYLNSTWLAYFMSNKQSLSEGMVADYGIFVNYLVEIKEVVEASEREYRDLISKHVDLANYPNWVVLLSEWRLLQTRPVGKVTDAVAKRFASYLKTGVYLDASFLYSDDDYAGEFEYTEKDAVCYTKYKETKFYIASENFKKELELLAKTIVNEIGRKYSYDAVTNLCDIHVSFDKFADQVNGILRNAKMTWEEFIGVYTLVVIAESLIDVVHLLTKNGRLKNKRYNGYSVNFDSDTYVSEGSFNLTTIDFVPALKYLYNMYATSVVEMGASMSSILGTYDVDLSESEKPISDVDLSLLLGVIRGDSTKAVTFNLLSFLDGVCTVLEPTGKFYPFLTDVKEAPNYFQPASQHYFSFVKSDVASVCKNATHYSFRELYADADVLYAPKSLVTVLIIYYVYHCYNSALTKFSETTKKNPYYTWYALNN